MPAPLNPTLYQEIMQQSTLLMFNRNPPWTPNDFSFVRVAWQTQGQPGPFINLDTITLRGTEVDDPYNRVRDVITNPDGGGDPTKVQQTTTYTRVWETTWCLYGPNSFDNARIIRSGLFLQNIHDFLANPYNLYLVTDISAPRRAPEYFDGQWWERVDFDAKFNELVTEIPTVASVDSSEVLVFNSTGQVADIEIEPT